MNKYFFETEQELIDHFVCDSIDTGNARNWICKHTISLDEFIWNKFKIQPQLIHDNLIKKLYKKIGGLDAFEKDRDYLISSSKESKLRRITAEIKEILYSAQSVLMMKRISLSPDFNPNSAKKIAEKLISVMNEDYE